MAAVAGTAGTLGTEPGAAAGTDSRAQQAAERSVAEALVLLAVVAADRSHRVALSTCSTETRSSEFAAYWEGRRGRSAAVVEVLVAVEVGRRRRWVVRVVVGVAALVAPSAQMDMNGGCQSATHIRLSLVPEDCHCSVCECYSVGSGPGILARRCRDRLAQSPVAHQGWVSSAPRFEAVHLVVEVRPG